MLRAKAERMVDRPKTPSSVRACISLITKASFGGPGPGPEVPPARAREALPGCRAGTTRSGVPFAFRAPGAVPAPAVDDFVVRLHAHKV